MGYTKHFAIFILYFINFNIILLYHMLQTKQKVNRSNGRKVQVNIVSGQGKLCQNNKKLG